MRSSVLGSFRLRVRRTRVSGSGGRGRCRARHERFQVRLDGAVADGELLLMDIEEGQVLLQDEDMFGPIVPGEARDDLRRGRVAAVFAMLREPLRVTLPGDNVTENALARHAGDVRDDERQLDIHLDQSLLHPLDIGPGTLDEGRAQVGAQGDDGIRRSEAPAQQAHHVEIADPFAVRDSSVTLAACAPGRRRVAGARSVLRANDTLGTPVSDRRVRFGMPELSRFFGIIIRMFTEVGAQHHAAHFHAYWQDDEAAFGIDPVQLLAGYLPTRQRRLVEAWAELHQRELIEAWSRLQEGHPARPINPLA